MKYFGIPYCPYCKKTVNIIRVWGIKKRGEFMCPRCKGVSNIYLSPLIYILAILAVGTGFMIYFFEKFIIDEVTLMTAVKVYIPFAAFFILSLFMVYFKKPVIRKIRKRKDGRLFDENGKEFVMRLGKLVPVAENRKNVPRNQNSSDMFSGEDDSFSDFNNFNFENDFINEEDTNQTEV